MRGKLIAFEGGEGAGKSTIIKKAIEHLKNANIDVIQLREPGGLVLSEKIRGLILSEDMDPVTEAMLFAAARSELMVKTIIPALEKGTHIILDRSVFSSLCYQGYCGIGMKEVYDINKHAMRGYFPDDVILLDVDPKIGLERVNERGEKNRIDEKPFSYHENVRKGYLSLVDDFPEIFHVVNANNNEDDVSLHVRLVLDSIFGIEYKPKSKIDFKEALSNLLELEGNDLEDKIAKEIGVSSEELKIRSMSMPHNTFPSDGVYMIEEKFKTRYEQVYAPKMYLRVENKKIISANIK